MVRYFLPDRQVHVESLWAENRLVCWRGSWEFRGRSEWWVGTGTRVGNWMFPALLGDQHQTTVWLPHWMVHIPCITPYIIITFCLAIIFINNVEILKMIPATNTEAFHWKSIAWELVLKKSHFIRNGSIFHVRENGTGERVGYSSFPPFFTIIRWF